MVTVEQKRDCILRGTGRRREVNWHDIVAAAAQRYREEGGGLLA